MSKSKEPETAKLIEALKPFADFAKIVAKDHPGWDHDEFYFDVCGHYFTLRPFRAAREALSTALARSQAAPLESEEEIAKIVNPDAFYQPDDLSPSERERWKAYAPMRQEDAKEIARAILDRLSPREEGKP